MPDVNLAAGHWPAGTKVQIIPRVGDAAGGDAVETVKATADGVEVKGLEAGPYWAVGDVETHVPGSKDPVTVSRPVAFVAKEAVPARKRTAAPKAADPQLTPSWTTPVEIVTGPRGTKVAGRVVESKAPREADEAPHRNMASVDAKTPLRSATPLGEAHEVPKGEL